MTKSNTKKKEQLGQDASTASNKLKKSLLFKYVCLANENYCFQCGAEIQNEEELSIEHKTPWLNSDTPNELFFGLDNIAFSHLSCNIAARRKPKGPCGTYWKYSSGCRCDECKEAHRKQRQKQRKKMSH